MGKEEKNGEEKKKGGIPDELWEFWEKRCARFQYVKWVQQWKPGVKVLKINT